jgi:hypothetical protein
MSRRDQMRLCGTRSDHKRSQEVGRCGLRNSSGNSSEGALAVVAFGPAVTGGTGQCPRSGRSTLADVRGVGGFFFRVRLICELRVLYCTDAGWPECYPYRGNGESHGQTTINEQSRDTRHTRRPNCWTSRQATGYGEGNSEENIDTGRAPTEQIEDGAEGEGKDSATCEGRAEGERGDGAKGATDGATEENAEASTKDRSEDRTEEEVEARPRARSEDSGDPQDVESTRTRRRRRGEGGARHTRRHVEGSRTRRVGRCEHPARYARRRASTRACDGRPAVGRSPDALKQERVSLTTPRSGRV